MPKAFKEVISQLERSISNHPRRITQPSVICLGSKQASSWDPKMKDIAGCRMPHWQTRINVNVIDRQIFNRCLWHPDKEILTLRGQANGIRYSVTGNCIFSPISVMSSREQRWLEIEANKVIRPKGTHPVSQTSGTQFSMSDHSETVQQRVCSPEPPISSLSCPHEERYDGLLGHRERSIQSKLKVSPSSVYLLYRKYKRVNDAPEI